MQFGEITKKKIKSFFQGYSRYYYDNIFDLADHIKEQVYYRISICQDTCLQDGKCEKCTCPTIQKAYANDSCNLEKFPDMMNKTDWDQFKLKNNINNIEDIAMQVEEAIAKIRKK